MKMFVEMDENQYEEYKKLLKGEYVSKDIGIAKFLEINGFKMTNNTNTFDLISQCEKTSMTFYKEGCEVVVKGGVSK